MSRIHPEMPGPEITDGSVAGEVLLRQEPDDEEEDEEEGNVTDDEGADDENDDDENDDDENDDDENDDDENDDEDGGGYSVSPHDSRGKSIVRAVTAITLEVLTRNWQPAHNQHSGRE